MKEIGGNKSLFWSLIMCNILELKKITAGYMKELDILKMYHSKSKKERLYQ
jgi:hypothetical protein